MKEKEGIVIKSTGKSYWIREKDGNIRQGIIKGNWRIKGIRTTNPLAVGDHVTFREMESGPVMIIGLKPRKNHIIRRSIKLSKAAHILAANVDQSILIATVDQPQTSYGFIDRFLVASESYHIEPVIVINKIDLKESEEKIAEMAAIYDSVGYRIMLTSAEKKYNIEEFKQLLKGKVSVLAGHSGVGKSTLINLVEPGLNLKTTPVSDFHRKGKHTTTYAEMHPLSFGGYVIDTPGIKGFGIVGIEKEELALYFPEMAARLPECKYYNCTHINEPGCAVKEAVYRGDIPESRYRSYLNMYFEDESQTYR